MSDFWKTVLSSIGLSLGTSGLLVWLCREWISARLHKSIQHEYDKRFADYEKRVQHEYDVQLEGFKSRIHYEYDLKLESSKTDFQRVLDEHQTQFKYWFDEKTKAIKELYANAGNLYCSLSYLHVAESNSPKQWSVNDQEKIEDELKKQVAFFFEKVINDWLKLRIFLSDDEDKLYYEFNGKTKMWFNVLLNPDTDQRNKYIEDNQKAILSDIDGVMDKLRTSFREALSVATKEASQNTINPNGVK